MKSKQTIYFVKKYDAITRRIEVLAELTDPAKAYELVHELDCALNLGGQEEDGIDKSENPCILGIEDQDGNDVWHECCYARCKPKGRFQ